MFSPLSSWRGPGHEGWMVSWIFSLNSASLLNRNMSCVFLKGLGRLTKQAASQFFASRGYDPPLYLPSLWAISACSWLRSIHTSFGTYQIFSRLWVSLYSCWKVRPCTGHCYIHLYNEFNDKFFIGSLSPAVKVWLHGHFEILERSLSTLIQSRDAPWIWYLYQILQTCTPWYIRLS